MSTLLLQFLLATKAAKFLIQVEYMCSGTRRSFVKKEEEKKQLRKSYRTKKNKSITLFVISIIASPGNFRGVFNLREEGKGGVSHDVSTFPSPPCPNFTMSHIEFHMGIRKTVAYNEVIVVTTTEMDLRRWHHGIVKDDCWRKIYRQKTVRISLCA